MPTGQPHRPLTHGARTGNPLARRTTLLAAVALLALGAGAYQFQSAWLPLSGTAHAQDLPAAPAVDIAPPVVRAMVDWQRYSGRLEAIDRVDIRPLVSGTLSQIHFQDGQLVSKGDLLFTIDPRPYAAAVERAQAALEAARARAAYTASDLARSRRLLADNAVARRDVEEKQNAAREATANLHGATAALQAARIDLEHTSIVAPVDGRVSRSEITVGNVVNAGAQSAILTTLVSVARMYAAFDVDEQTFLRHVQPAHAAGMAVPVQLGLANEDGYSRQGQVHSIDNRLDTASGTIRVRALIDNANGDLLPGLYARIQLGGSMPRDAVLVDETAIGTDQDKRYVLVVDADNKTAYREVTLGANAGAMRVVESGLAPQERIVVNGLQRVRPGETVSPTQVSMDAASANLIAARQ